MVQKKDNRKNNGGHLTAGRKKIPEGLKKRTIQVYIIGSMYEQGKIALECAASLLNAGKSIQVIESTPEDK